MAGSRVVLGTNGSDRIVRIVEEGRPEPFNALPVTASGNVWSQIKVEEYRREPGEEREGAPTQHMLVLNVGPAYRRELSWADEPGPSLYTLESGRIVIIPAGARFRARWLDALHVLVLQIDPALLVEAAEGREVRLPRTLDVRDDFLAHLMLALCDALKEDGPHTRLYGEHLAVTVAMHLVQKYAAHPPAGEVSPGAPGLPMNRMRRVAEHIDAHLDAPLSLLELARVAEMSLFHFARLFKLRAGVPPHQYVLRKRIDRAKELLGAPAPTIAEIAVRCGFSHQPHFTKAFHQIAGVTPTEWRDRACGRAV